MNGRDDKRQPERDIFAVRCRNSIRPQPLTQGPETGFNCRQNAKTASPLPGKATPDPARPFIWFSAGKEPKYAREGRDYLPVAARMAPVFLQKRSEKGFFLMIEGSQIDWACHKNDADNAIGEMLDFDAAIGAALDFAAADGQTLVIITADHETGGMSIIQGSEMGKLEIEFTTKQHTASMVPVFAYGPGAELFNGVYDNTGIYFKIAALLGFDTTAGK